MNTNSTATYDTHQAERYFAQKNAYTIGPVEVSQKLKGQEPVVVVDVREEEDYRQGHVPAAVSLSENAWSSCQGLSKDVPNILYCYSQTCHLAARAAEQFAHQGFVVMEMEGGFEAWKALGLEVARS